MSPVSPVCFVDLDDTLFQTARKNPDHSGVVSAIDRDNQPRSFFTHTQHQWMQWLLAHAHVIPVTARDRQQYQRVTIPFTSWAIVSMGAVLLTPDGRVDSEWEEYVITRARPREQIIRNIAHWCESMARNCDSPLSIRLITEYSDLAVMLVIKTASHEQAHSIRDAVRSELNSRAGSDHGWHCVQHDRQVTVFHSELTKRHATAFLLNRLHREHGPFPTMGYGDNLSDYGFMSLCDWRGIPADSAIDITLRTTIDPFL